MKKFRLKGIKGFEDTGDIEIKPITIVLGQNNSGKSSILRFPLVLKQTFLDDSIAPLLFYGKSIDYGNYDDVVFRHDIKQPMTFKLTIDKEELKSHYFFFEEFVKDKIKNYSSLDILVTISMSENKTLEVDQLTLTGFPGDKVIFSYRVLENNTSAAIKFENEKEQLINKHMIFFDKFIPNFRVINNKKHKESMNKILEKSGKNEYFFMAISRFLNDLANEIFYIGPFRANPERAYRYKENAVNYVGHDGEFAPVILAQDYKKGGRLIEDVSSFLSDTLGVSLSIENLVGNTGLNTDFFRILINDHVTKVQNNLIDVGFGLSQLIPVVIQVLMNNNAYRFTGFSNSADSIHIIEQPELHLHPAAQAALIDLFIKGFEMNKSKKFIVETHSEHMLLRLRRYVIEGKISTNNIALYYTYKDRNGFKNKIKKLDIDESGKILEWPEGFFEEDFDELSKLQQALFNKNSKSTKGDLPWL